MPIKSTRPILMPVILMMLWWLMGLGQDVSLQKWILSNFSCPNPFIICIIRFSKVPNYPILMEWLDNEPEDHPDDQDVWGSDMVKSSYNFSDLEKWYKKQEGKREKKAKKDEREEGSKVVKDKKKKKQVK